MVEQTLDKVRIGRENVREQALLFAIDKESEELSEVAREDCI
jgi:hypothetical protein